MRKVITKRAVDALTPGELLVDTKISGFLVRRLPSGRLSYGFRYYSRAGKRQWLSLGLHGEITPDEARTLAKRAAGHVAEGRDPVLEEQKARAVESNNLNMILDQYLSRHVRKLRNRYEIERVFRVYVRPRLGKRSIYDLGRQDIIKLLDNIEDSNGAVMADMALAYLRGAFNWWALRDEQFRPPIMRGMVRTNPKERARTRTLSDLELRVVWEQAGSAGPFGRMLRFILLTSARLSEARLMIRSELDGRDWTLPAARNKTKVDLVRPLSDAAVAVLPERIEGCEFVFTSNGKSPISEPAPRLKRRSDIAVLTELRRIGEGCNDKALLAYVSKVKELMEEVRKARGNERKQLQADPRAIWWTIHDLRRTSRTLLSRAGVLPDHAERVLGHVVPGVRSIYDRFEFYTEKKEALERLAAMIERILHPDETVVPFSTRQRWLSQSAQV
jgi:integrase